jgi:hypothetical protein
MRTKLGSGSSPTRKNLKVVVLTWNPGACADAKFAKPKNANAVIATMLNVFIAVPFGSFRGEKTLPVFSCCPPLTSTIEVSLFGFVSSAQLKQKIEHAAESTRFCRVLTAIILLDVAGVSGLYALGERPERVASRRPNRVPSV